MPGVPLAPSRRRLLPPAAASAAVWADGAVLHAVMPPAVGAVAAGAVAGLAGGTAAFAAWHEASGPLRRAWLASAAAWGTGWAALAGAGAAHGPALGTAIAGAGLIAATWPARRERARRAVAAPRSMDAGEIAALRADWAVWVAAPDGPLPGARLEHVTQTSTGLVADIALQRGRQTATAAMRRAEEVASGLERPVTQVVLEPAPDGRSSRARLSVLTRDVLAEPVPWAGSELEPDTGLAACGRYFDGAPAHVRFWLPGNGAAHWLIAGTTGSGKTGFLHWLLATITDPGNPVPVVPFLIDPEEGGQSLIAWQSALRYSYAGEDQSIAALRGLDAMMAYRMRKLAADGLDYFTPSARMPLVLPVIEEAPVLLAESAHKDEAALRLTRIGTKGRKRGLGIAAVTQLAGLDQISSSAFRSMMRSGNAVCHRTADPLTHNMLGLQADPSLLPKQFADGTPAYGVCLIDGPDGRQSAPLRTQEISPEVKRQIVARALEHPLDAGSAEAFRAAYEASFEAARGTEDAPAAPVVPASAPVPSGAAAAILALLADSQPRMRGEVLMAVKGVTTNPSTVTQALRRLADEGLVHSAGDKQPWEITPAGREAARRAA